MAVTKITWENKTGIQNDASVLRKNKVTDADMNEIKQVVNNNADELAELQEKFSNFKNYDDTEIKEDIEELQTNDTKQDELISKLKNAALNAETEELKSLHVTDANKFGQLEVLGNQEQEVREGYNLLQNNLTDTTINGVTFTINEDKSVTVNGTATASIIANLTTGEFEDGDGNITNFTIPDDVSTLKLIGCPSGGSGSTYKLDLWSSRGVLEGTDYGEGTNISISSDNDRELNRARIIIYAGATVNNLTFKPMLVAGTEEKPYEQYGVMPSPDYPSPVVCVGSNKNLLNTSLMTETTKGGITSKINPDGSITFDGICNVDNNVFDFFIENQTKFMFNAISKQTTISAFYVSGNITDKNNEGAFFRICDSNYNGGNINLTNLPAEKIMTGIYNSTSGNVFCDIRIDKNVVLDNFTIMLKASNTLEDALIYSPYEQGSTLISKINKNLAIVDTQNLWYDSNTNKFVTSTTTASVLARIKENQKITITKTNASNRFVIVTSSERPKLGVGYKTIIIDNESTRTEYAFVNVEEKWLWFGVYNGTDETEKQEALEGIQIEVQNKTDYVEHQQEDYLLYIQQEMLKGDYFIKDKNGWKEVHNLKKTIFTGNENWSKSSVTTMDRFLLNISDLTIVNNLDKTDVYSNCFKAGGYGVTELQYIWHNGNVLAINYTNYNTTTLEEFKQMLADKYNAGNQVYVFYKSATPTKLPCTKEQSAVLEELSNLDLFEGVNNIITAEDIALLKLKYALDVKTYVDNQLANVNAQILNIAGGN